MSFHLAINVRPSSENVEMNASSLQEKPKTKDAAIDLAGDDYIRRTIKGHVVDHGDIAVVFFFF